MTDATRCNTCIACEKTVICFDTSGRYSEGLPSVSKRKGVYELNRSKDLAFESADCTSDILGIDSVVGKSGRTC